MPTSLEHSHFLIHYNFVIISILAHLSNFIRIPAGTDFGSQSHVTSNSASQFNVIVYSINFAEHLFSIDGTRTRAQIYTQLLCYGSTNTGTTNPRVRQRPVLF
jgi:hypothetical protein